VGRPETWLEFWEEPPGAFGPDARNRGQAAQVARAAIEALGLGAGDRLLDWGCGYGLGARVYDEAGIAVLLFDRSVHARRAARRLAGAGVVLSEAGLADLEPASLDAVVVHSVVQYLDEPELEALLGLACELLKPGGRLLLADLIPPDAGLLADLKAFLPRRPGSLPRRLRHGLELTLRRDYGRLRRTSGLLRLDRDEAGRLLGDAGFDMQELPANAGPNRSRWSAVGTRREDR